MNKTWWIKQKKTTIAAVITGALLLIGGRDIILQFLLVGAIPGTTYSLPSGVMLMLFGVTIWMLFCQRSATYYVKNYIDQQRVVTPLIARLPQRRYSEL